MATVHTIPALEKAEASIRRLLTWDEGWNGYGAQAPTTPTVEHALSWLGALYADTSDVGLPWLEPNITASADGEVVFEWWQSSRKLTVYIDDVGATYLQVWGPDVDNDMAEGDADERNARRQIWQWLVGA